MVEHSCFLSLYRRGRMKGGNGRWNILESVQGINTGLWDECAHQRNKHLTKAFPRLHLTDIKRNNGCHIRFCIAASRAHRGLPVFREIVLTGRFLRRSCESCESRLVKLVAPRYLPLCRASAWLASHQLRAAIRVPCLHQPKPEDRDDSSFTNFSFTTVRVRLQ